MSSDRAVFGALCGSEYLEVGQPVVFCPTCERRRRMLYMLEAWRGAVWTCLSCGERWHSDDGRMERPFMRGWRVKSVRAARERWARYGRVRLTSARIRASFGLDGDA